jgi:hypothetical protein
MLFEKVALIKRKIKLSSVNIADTKILFSERKMAKYLLFKKSGKEEEWSKKYPIMDAVVSLN